MTRAEINQLMAVGLTLNEVWCAIAEPGPWTASTLDLTDPTAPQGDYLGD